MRREAEGEEMEVANGEVKEKVIRQDSQGSTQNMGL